MEPGGVFTVLAYHLQYALVADSVVHSDSSVGSLSLLHAECQGGRAYGKDPRVVEIAEVVIEPDLVCLVARSVETASGGTQALRHLHFT